MVPDALASPRRVASITSRCTVNRPARPTTTSVALSSTTSVAPTTRPSDDPPAGVPAGIAMPEGIELGTWQETTRDGKRVLTIVGTISDAEGYGPSVFDWITTSLIDMGYSLENSTEGEADGRYTASVMGVETDHTVKVTVTELGPDIRVDYEVLPDP